MISRKTERLIFHNWASYRDKMKKNQMEVSQDLLYLVIQSYLYFWLFFIFLENNYRACFKLVHRDFVFWCAKDRNQWTLELEQNVLNFWFTVLTNCLYFSICIADWKGTWRVMLYNRRNLWFESRHTWDRSQLSSSQVAWLCHAPWPHSSLPIPD